MASAATIAASPSVKLTCNDFTVLQAIFDAESSPSPSSSVTTDSSLPSFPTVSESDLRSLKARELGAIRKIYRTDNSCHEIETAIAELDTLIAEAPSYPSAYANRAQALRLLIESQAAHNEVDDNALFATENISLATQLFSDLGQAITLTTPSSFKAGVSTAQARLLANTHTHRGYLLLKAAKRESTHPEHGGPKQLQNINSKDVLEEMASRDFFLGGSYGNPVAKQLAITTNPYAKMCGAIVKEALRKEMEEYVQNSET